MLDSFLPILDSLISVHNILFCLLGVFLGTLVGVVPGFGPLPAISILLPFSVGLGNPLTGLIFISGIYYGTQYGGSTTSILLKLPGESSSAVIATDGYELSRQGKGMTALAIAAIGSFIGGTIGVIFLGLFSLPISQLALMFGPAEYTVTLILALLLTLNFTQQNKILGLFLLCLGVLLGSVGTQISTGLQRFTFGFPELSDGISFVVLSCSLFGIAEVIYGFFHKNSAQTKIGRHIESAEIKRTIPAMLRGSSVGSLLGSLPGIGVITSSFLSYGIEKKLAKDRDKFGQGSMSAIAGPESANNAAAQTAFVPALSMGIPATPVMSLILAYLIMMGIQPGPQFINNNQNLFWSLILSMWIGNLFLLILNLPLINLWIKILSVPKTILNFIILSACIAGTYMVGNGWFDVWLLIPFSLLGIMLKFKNIDPTPILFGFILGPMIEEHLERTLLITQNNWLFFLDKPICMILLLFALIFSIAWIIVTKKISLTNTA